jgi:hypothetical protein
MRHTLPPRFSWAMIAAIILCAPALRADPLATNLRLHVRVVDTRGKPVPNAVVEVLVRAEEGDAGTSRVEFIDFPVLRTDAEGMLVTPPLAPGRAYVLTVDARRSLPALSRWSRPGDIGEIRLPDVVLRKLHRVTGVVVDRDGRPVAGATVIQSGDGPVRIDTTTDANGRFTIDGIPEGVAFVCVSRPGYRFGGRRVSAEKGPIRIALERADEPNQTGARTIAPRRSKLSDEERQALAVELMRAPFDEMLSNGPQAWNVDIVHALIAVDPEFVSSQMARIDRLQIRKSHREDLLCRLATGLANTNLSESERLISQLGDGDKKTSPSEIAGRFWAYSDLVRVLPKSDRATRLRLLSEMTRLVRLVDNDDTRIYWICDAIVPFLVEQGDLEEARTLLSEARKAAESLPADDDPNRRTRAYSRLACAYARLDPKTAVSILQECRNDDIYTTVQVCTAVAACDPETAERLLKRVEFRDNPSKQISMRFCLSEICFRMAHADIDRAERIMGEFWDQTQPPRERTGEVGNTTHQLLKAHVLGSLAEAAVRSDKLKAAQFLEQAVATLAALQSGTVFDNDYEAEHEFFYGSPATTMATLIPVAERIDPASSREIFWRALALREPPLSGEGAECHRRDIANALLALLIARYDHETADALFEPVMERELSRSFNGSSIDHWVYDVRHRLDPDSTVRFARELLASPPMSRGPPADRALRIHTARMLVIQRVTNGEDEQAQHEKGRRMVQKTMLVDVGSADFE